MAIDYNFQPKGLKSKLGWYDRGYIPHFDGGQIPQFFTFRLFDSLPRSVLEKFREATSKDGEEGKIAFRKNVERFLDSGYGECFLKNPAVSQIVADNLRFHHGKKYHLSAWIIMPNHIHFLATPLENAQLREIAHSIKSYTAHKANKNGTVYGIGGHGDPNQGIFRGMCNTDLALMPALLPIQASIKEVAAGTDHALFLTNTHNVWSLGANLAGQGGSGTPTAQECPAAVSATSVKAISQLAGGKEHSLAMVTGILAVSPSPVTFGNVAVGTRGTLTVTVTNSGLAPVVFQTIEVSPANEFSATHDCPNSPGMLAPGASCTMKVNFDPASAGSRTGKIVFTSDAAGSPQEVILTGSGT